MSSTTRTGLMRAAALALTLSMMTLTVFKAQACKSGNDAYMPATKSGVVDSVNFDDAPSKANSPKDPPATENQPAESAPPDESEPEDMSKDMSDEDMDEEAKKKKKSLEDFEVMPATKSGGIFDADDLQQSAGTGGL